jgi:CHAD domain-containing protein
MELRLRVLGGITEALRSRFGKAVPVRHRVLCFDTPDRRLRRAGVVLALRQDGTSRSQVAAVSQEDADLAHSQPLPGLRRAPLPLPELHRVAPVGALLDDALGAEPLSPVPVSSLELKRRILLMRTHAARIQVTLIEGSLRGDTDLRHPFCEIELSLRSGPPAALYQVARRLAHQHAMFLEPCDPMARVVALALGKAGSEPVSARPARLGPSMAPEKALKLMIQACLHQIVGNVASLVAGSANTEHLHQLRVGLRRLRSVLRLFGDWADVPANDWEQALSEPARTLSDLRDMDVLRTEVIPRLAAQGGPPLPPEDEGASTDSLKTLLSSADFTGVLIDMLAYARTEAEPAAGAKSASKLARRRLSKLSKRLRAEAKDFAAASDPERHRLRKRLKRLRYGLELGGDLLPNNKSQQMLASIKPVQDALGLYNDMCMAEARFRQMRNCPGTRFALGWAAALHAQALSRSMLEVKRWRRDNSRA